MARTTWQSFTYGGLVDPVAVVPPLEWEKAEVAIIRLRILSRDPNVGKTDLSKIIVREWSGYWYLYRDNYQISSGSIDYKTEQIYFDRWLWTAEVATQQLAQRVPLIETTQPEENVEELSEFLILGGQVLGNLIANLDIPIVGNVLEFIVSFFEDLSSDDLNYIPAPYRPDKVYVWFPVGMVELDIEFHWLGYSPIAIGGGIAEVPLEELQQIPELPQADDPMNPAPATSFHELATAKGYVLIGENIKTFCESNGYFPPEVTIGKYLITWNVVSANYTGILGYRGIVVESFTVPIVGAVVRYSPTGDAPDGDYAEAAFSRLEAVTPLSPMAPSGTSGTWYVGSVETSEGEVYTILYGQSANDLQASISVSGVEELP